MRVSELQTAIMTGACDAEGLRQNSRLAPWLIFARATMCGDRLSRLFCGFARPKAQQAAQVDAK